METFKQLENLAGPIIKSYRNDLIKHDKKDIEGNPGTPFLHFTGESGTHIVFMQPAEHNSWPAPGERVPYLFSTANRRQVLSGKTRRASRQHIHETKRSRYLLSGSPIHK